MLSKNKVNININTSLTDYFYDIPNKYILDSNMMLAFATSVSGKTTKAASEVSFKFTQNNLVFNVTTNRTDLVKDDKTLSPWTSSMFHPDIYQQFQYDIDRSDCPLNKRDMYLKGSTNAKEYSYITIDVYKDMCASWLSMQDFIDQINYVQLRVFIQSSYVDFRDVDNAVIMKGTFKYLNLNLGTFTSLGLKISENDYAIEDSYFFTSFNKGSFYSLSSSDTSSYTNRNKTDSGLIGQVLIKLEDYKTDYNVKIYTFYDFIAQLGGIYEIIYEFLGIIGFYLTKKLYEHSLVMSMTTYQKRKHPDLTNEDKRKQPIYTNIKANTKLFIETFQNRNNPLNYERRRNKLEADQKYILNYNYRHLMRIMMWPAKIWNWTKEIKKYLGDIDQLKVDISLESIIQSITNLKDQVAKINEDRRQQNYQEENVNI